MVLREVPREEWDTVLETFSRQHRDEPVTLEKSDIRDGLRVAARAAPLKSVTHDRVTAQIAITLGETPSGEVTHTVTQPDGVAVEEPSEANEDPRIAVHVTGGGQHVVVRVAHPPPLD
jgi:hypothetical protein